MLSSSSTRRLIDGSAIMRLASPQAASAAATSRARSCVSQVKPSPIVRHSTWVPKRSTPIRSPVDQAPLMNCTTPTRKPRPRARRASPNAAVDLPLPAPVWTMRRPFSSIGFAATSASCAALRLTIFALCRSASGRFMGRFRARLGALAPPVSGGTEHKAFAASLRRDERLRGLAAPLEDHRGLSRFGASRDPQQPVVEIGQAVEGDWSALKDPEPDTDDPRIARRQGDRVQHDQPAVGKHFAEFIDPLHPQSLHVTIAVRRVDGIISGHHRGIEGVDPPDARIGIGRELRQPAAERMADRGNLGPTRSGALVAFDMGDEVAHMVADLIVLIVDGKSAQDPVEVGFPVSLVAPDGSAEGDDSFRTLDALAGPDLDPQASDGLALPGRPHLALVRSVATPDVAPFVKPAGRALVVRARLAILGVVGATRGGARRDPVSRVDPRIV